MIKKQNKRLKNLIFALLAFLIVQESKAQTTLAAGDMAIIGINYDVVPYELTMVTFVNISAGTTIRITDYGYDSGTGSFAAVSLTNTSEGSIAWTTTSSIPANTVIKMAVTVSTGPSVSGLPGTTIITGWTNTAPTSCPSPAGGDNWFIFQGPNATTVTNWVFGWTNPFATTHNSVPQVAGQFLQPGSGAPNNGNSYLPPGLTLGLNAIALNYDASLGGFHGDNDVYTGIKCGSQTTVLNAICNTANWLTNETTTYNIDPGGTYFPGINPIFCVTAPCTTPTLNLIAKNDVLCNGGSTGSATMSATGGAPFTYTWSPSGGNSNVATGLSTGIYTCVTTNSCGSTASQTVNITQPTAVAGSTAVTNALCNGSQGSATITLSGGTSPYTYTWSSGPTTSVEPTLLAGTYTVRGTDANGCSITKSVTISQPSALVTSTAVTNVLCFGNSTGSATITASGGTGSYTYLWSTAATTSVITGQTSGVKTVTVTDANSCTSVKSVNINQPASALSTATAVTNVLCFGNSTGSATVTASGGTGSYTYLWSTAATSSVITAQNAGVKTVTVTDANGCTSVKSVNINQPASALTASQSQTNITCFNPNGFASVNASGGTGTYTYSWIPAGGTSSVSSALTPGNFTCNIADANNCTVSQTFAIIANTVAPSVTITGTTQICNGQSAILTANGANTYNWSTTATSNTILVSPSVSTTYSVTGTNAVNGCNATATFTLIVNSTPTVSVNSGTICSGSNFTIAPGGANTYTIQGGNAVVSPTANTSYTVVGTSSAGCLSANTATSNVTVNALPLIGIIQPTLICESSTVVINSTGANTYTWSGPCVSTPTTAALSIPSVSLSCSGVYTLSGTDANGCSNTTTANVLISPLPTITPASSSTLVCTLPTQQSATLTASGSASTWIWNPGSIFSSTAVVSPTISTTYSVTGVTAVGCSTFAVITVSVSACTGVNQIASTLNEINVYPNPFNNKITIVSSGSKQSLSIYNVLGSIIYSTVLEDEKTEIDLSKEQTGIYFIRIGNTTRKIIKE